MKSQWNGRENEARQFLLFQTILVSSPWPRIAYTHYPKAIHCFDGGAANVGVGKCVCLFREHIFSEKEASLTTAANTSHLPSPFFSTLTSLYNTAMLLLTFVFARAGVAIPLSPAQPREPPPLHITPSTSFTHHPSPPPTQHTHTHTHSYGRHRHRQCQRRAHHHHQRWRPGLLQHCPEPTS